MQTPSINHSLVDESVYGLALGDACIEALNILSTLHSLDAGLSELKVASLGTVVQEVDLGLNFEGLELEALAVLAEYFDLVHCSCRGVGGVHFIESLFLLLLIINHSF